jgi:hypothetical protein
MSSPLSAWLVGKSDKFLLVPAWTISAPFYNASIRCRTVAPLSKGEGRIFLSDNCQLNF